MAGLNNLLRNMSVLNIRNAALGRGVRPNIVKTGSTMPPGPFDSPTASLFGSYEPTASVPASLPAMLPAMPIDRVPSASMAPYVSPNTILPNIPTDYPQPTPSANSLFSDRQIAAFSQGNVNPLNISRRWLANPQYRPGIMEIPYPEAPMRWRGRGVPTLSPIPRFSLQDLMRLLQSLPSRQRQRLGQYSLRA